MYTTDTIYCKDGLVAQSGLERLASNQMVVGSNPTEPATFLLKYSYITMFK